MNIINDSILVFEYFTASGENDKSIISEAEYLIYSLLDDLKEFNVSLIVNRNYSYIADKYDNVNGIIIDEDLEDYLKNNIGEFKK